MKLNSVFLYLLLTLSISILTPIKAVYAQNQEDASPDRWFEIEVILFKQLGNKAELKEQFPSGINASKLPTYKQSYDLLGAYLQPNLTAIKQFMPLCSTENDENDNNIQVSNVDVDLFKNIAIVDTSSAIDQISRALTNTLQPNEELVSHFEPSSITQSALTESTLTESKSNEYTASLNLNLDFHAYEQTLINPIYATNNLCVITQNDMNNILSEEQLAQFKLHSFGVEALPSQLDAPEIHNDEHPYLISNESLLLKDITQNLRWGREFQPLFHFGWRQIGITEKKAIPIKLFAGEHIEYQYKKALAQYQSEIKAATEIENNLLTQISPHNQIEDEVEINFTQKQQALSELFAKLDALPNYTTSEASASNEITSHPINDSVSLNVSHNVSDLVDSISNQNLNSFLTQNNTTLKPSEFASPPLQPWFLDGFFKVHLDHYLYITADFNLFNQTPDVKINTNDYSEELKLINFSQNRRVITGEIHYFDHPYVGMIVQIRRFDPTKPEGERVSQSIK